MSVASNLTYFLVVRGDGEKSEGDPTSWISSQTLTLVGKGGQKCMLEIYDMFRETPEVT